MNRTYETEITNREISGTDDNYAKMLNKPVANFIPWKKHFFLPEEGKELMIALNSVAEAVAAAMSYECWGEVNVSISTVIKNNNLVLHGVIIKLKDQCVIPTVYIEDILEHVGRKELMQNLADRIIEAYTDGLKAAPAIVPKIDTSYESLAGLLEIRVVDTEMNRERLDNLVHKEMNCGLSLVLYAIIEQDNSGVMGLAITEEIATHMTGTENADRGPLFLQAICNTVEFHPPFMLDIQDVIKAGPGGGSFGDREHNLLGDYDMKKCITKAMREEMNKSGRAFSCEGGRHATGASDEISEMYILTNESGTMGAAALFYPGIQEIIGNLLDSDYFVLPSSVHEVIIVPDRNIMSGELLEEMVKDANNTFLDKQDVLSYRVLRYSCEERRLSAIA